MVPSKFPRQFLEVGIPFYRKLYFSEQSNYFISIWKVEKSESCQQLPNERPTYFLSTSMGPTELSVLMRKTGLNTQVRCGAGQSLKPRILPTADKVLQLAHMPQTGKKMARVNIPKEPAQHLRHAKQKIIFWTQNGKNEPKTDNARSTQEQASFTLREQDKHEPRPGLED